jgi:hypothetical protein
VWDEKKRRIKWTTEAAAVNQAYESGKFDGFDSFENDVICFHWV